MTAADGYTDGVGCDTDGNSQGSYNFLLILHRIRKCSHGGGGLGTCKSGRGLRMCSRPLQRSRLLLKMLDNLEVPPRGHEGSRMTIAQTLSLQIECAVWKIEKTGYGYWRRRGLGLKF